MAIRETEDRAWFPDVLEKRRVWFGSRLERKKAVDGVDAREAGLRKFRAG